MIIPLHYLPHEIDDAIKNPSLDERSRKILRNLWETFEALEEDNRDLDIECQSLEAQLHDVWETFEALEEDNRDLDIECQSLEAQLHDVSKEIDELHKALEKAEYENKELQRLLDAIEDLLRP